MKNVQGNNGGTIKRMEKGDPSPNKGKRRNSTSSLVATYVRTRRERLSRALLHDAILYLAEFAPKELEAMVRKGELPAVLSVMVAGWLDSKSGFENLRKSLEMVFGKPTEHTDITTGGNPLDNALSRLTASQLDELIDKLAKDDIRSDRR